MEGEDPLITTGVLSQSPAQFTSLLALREGITEAVSKEGKAYKYDISIPQSTFKQVVDTTREHIRNKGLLKEGAVRHVIGYGHVGDGMQSFLVLLQFINPFSGNLHLNIVADQYSQEIQDALEPFVYELVCESCNNTYTILAYTSLASLHGSISAEHGIGSHKTHALHYSKNAVSIEWMKKIKKLFDERGIMNPGKVLE